VLKAGVATNLAGVVSKLAENACPAALPKSASGKRSSAKMNARSLGSILAELPIKSGEPMNLPAIAVIASRVAFGRVSRSVLASDVLARPRSTKLVDAAVLSVWRGGRTVTKRKISSVMRELPGQAIGEHHDFRPCTEKPVLRARSTRYKVRMPRKNAVAR
jgi:hypothetical protein